MGWYYTYNATRKDVIAELTANTEHMRTLAHTVRGNVLWTVQEAFDEKGTDRWIGCYLLSNPRLKGEAGYKPMSEAMGPYYYSCPLAYLEMVPEVRNAEWREGVRKHHARVNRKLAVGQTVQLIPSCNPNQLTITSIKPLRGVDANGNRYTIPRRFLA